MIKRIVGIGILLIVFQVLSLNTVYAVPVSDDSTEFQLDPIAKGNTQIYVMNDATNYFKPGFSIVVDKYNSYEYRDVVAISYDSDLGATLITFNEALKLDHLSDTSGKGLIVDRAGTVPRIDPAKLKLQSVVSGGEIKVVDEDKILKVGDTIIINPGVKWDSYSISRGLLGTNPAGQLTVAPSTTGLQVGDSLVTNRGLANEKIYVIKTIIDSTKITVTESVNTVISPAITAQRLQIEKSQILSIINNGDNTRNLVLKTALRYSHSANEQISITNTASTKFEHDSSYYNAQNGGQQEAKSVGGVTIPATNGPHGKYTSNTNACGRCHQLHAAPSPKLIRFPIAASVEATNPIYATCTFCHTFNGQSTYDVKNGQIWDTPDGKRYATNGGGFERMLVVEGEPENATFVKVTSKHRVAEQKISSTKYASFNAPGGYVDPQGHVQLTCTSCHQPHGTKNGRQLVEKVNTKTNTGADIQRDTSTDGSALYTNGAVIVNVENPFKDEKTKYSVEILSFCGSCHYDYNNTVGPSNETGLYSKAYRHKMGMSATDTGNRWNSEKDYGFDTDGNGGHDQAMLVLPVTTEGNGKGAVICTTCHFAHGTFTKTDGVKQYDEINLNSNNKLNTVGGWETPKNLRLDNRGVCQNCHNRNSDTIPPKLTDILNPNSDGSDVYESDGTVIQNKKVSSFTNDSIMIRFNQYMWTNPQGHNFGVYPQDVENPAHYNVIKDPAGARTSVLVKRAKLQPDGRTVLLYFDNGAITSGTFEVRVSGGADLNWNNITTPETATFTK